MRRRLILIAATWAAVVGLIAGSAQAQSPTPPGGQFVLIGVVLLEGERGLAFVQEPNFTNNKVVTVHLGDSVGPYRVTKILTHQVELTGPDGTVSVPLAGLPGAVTVASSAGTVQRPAGEMPPPPALSNPNVIVIPRGDPRRNFPVSVMLPGAPPGSTAASGESKPQTSVLPAMQRPAADAPPKTIVIPRGDPRRNFPVSVMLPGR